VLSTDSQKVRGAESYPHLELQCPRCRADIRSLDCESCGLSMQVEQGVVQALPLERAAHYGHFIQEYEGIRAAEGRGAADDSYYLGLPYEDTTGRNREQWRIRAKSFDCLLRKVLEPVGSDLMVLDIGAGNCWMGFRLALEGHRPVAVDLLRNDRDGLAAAVHYDKYLVKAFPRFEAEMTRLPFAAEQFDVVVFNASFHYAESYVATLGEALRCLKIGGRVVLCDTPWYSCEESGQRMIAERQAAYLRRYGTASASIASLEYLTDERLSQLERRFSIQWQIHQPSYGLSWKMRPMMAKIRGRREPSRFRIYVAKRNG
jgi:ubiquinone/menaquinone biosynthesis C-methylase UbiE